MTIGPFCVGESSAQGRRLNLQVLLALRQESLALYNVEDIDNEVSFVVMLLSCAWKAGMKSTGTASSCVINSVHRE